MRKYWWKILGVALLVYTFTMGLLIPLSPGIYKLNPGFMNAGQSDILEITGYNTFYTKTAEPVRVWLKYDSLYAIAADKVDVIDDRKLQAHFDLPKYLPVTDRTILTNLIVYDDHNGASTSKSAVTIVQDSLDKNETLGIAAWSVANIAAYGKEEVSFPFKKIIYETIRNLFFHVPFWFAMFIIFIAGISQSIMYLRTNDPEYDYKSMSFTLVGTLFGIIGLCTGMIWAKDTWGTYWSWQEVKMNMTAIALLIYLSYFILRQSFDDDERSARISAVFSIFAFAAMIALLYVVPRMVSSLHPGAEGNPAFSEYDLDSTMRWVFYPAIIGWT
ncbi:MAG: heme exporter protein C, partial [Saprospiraceae bacterium]